MLNMLILQSKLTMCGFFAKLSVARWTLASGERSICRSQFISHQLSLSLCRWWPGACGSHWWWLLWSCGHLPLFTARLHKTSLPVFWPSCRSGATMSSELRVCLLEIEVSSLQSILYIEGAVIQDNSVMYCAFISANTQYRHRVISGVTFYILHLCDIVQRRNTYKVVRMVHMSWVGHSLS